MATGAAKMMLRCVLEGSLAMYDIEIERRPYHRNCSCALHNLKGVCSSACSRTRNISYPKKQAWRDSSLSIAFPKFSSHSSLPSLGDSSEAEKTSMGLCQGFIFWPVSMKRDNVAEQSNYRQKRHEEIAIKIWQPDSLVSFLIDKRCTRQKTRYPEGDTYFVYL
ncbi:hypothetical protein CRYUN_Cryun03dG0079900 [Craigia yunnanensis]